MSMFARLITRPSPLTGTLCSLVAHAGMIAVMSFWWSVPVTQFSTAGQRDAIHVEAAFSTSLVCEPIDVVPERELAVKQLRPYSAEKLAPTPELDHSGLVPSLTADLSVPIQKPTLLPQETTPNIERLADLVSETTSLNEQIAPSPSVRRHSIEVASVDAILPESPPRVHRHTLELPSPRRTLAVDQVVGVMDKIQPDLSGNRPPPYPPEAIRLGIEGTVLLRLHIDETGQVVRVDIVQSSGYSMLDQAATQAVQSWRGFPASRGGEPVSTDELLPVRFRL